MTDFTLQTVSVDLPALTVAFTRRLRDAGLPVGPDHATRFAAALALTRPVARRRLYFAARTVFITDRGQLRAFDAVFAEVFGTAPPAPGATDDHVLQAPPAESGPPPPRDPQPRFSEEALGAGGAPPASGGDADDATLEVPVGMTASDEEVLRTRQFDRLTAAELAGVARMMSRLAVQLPQRRRRRTRRHRRGDAVDLRRTLRLSLRSAGEPVVLARRRRRIEPRPVVLLCDISGSMEPYARAYLQFLGCVTASTAHAEAFVFATRLTRLTRPLRSGRPERAIQRAAEAVPDWSGGTRIAAALAAFIDRHGRRGMARGAVIVIVSDGWERGDPRALELQMQRLARLAHRIVWVNPRVAARDFRPRTGGMAAALPYCDALVSGHTMVALDEVVAAIAAPRTGPRGVAGGAGVSPAAGVAGAGATAADADEPWGSATPVAGSSVAMPSGYGPSRGRTTPGWGAGG